MGSLRPPPPPQVSFPIDPSLDRDNWAELSRLDFEAPDRDAFPCLDLAYRAGRAGGLAPAALNAAICFATLLWSSPPPPIPIPPIPPPPPPPNPPNPFPVPSFPAMSIFGIS